MTPLDDSSILIRRIVGLPGETIQIKEGRVYANGEAIKERYEFEPMASSGQANSELTLAKDEYFVLSDNRADMDDSRNVTFTKVKRENIIGKVILVLNPLSLPGGPEKRRKDSRRRDLRDERIRDLCAAQIPVYEIAARRQNGGDNESSVVSRPYDKSAPGHAGRSAAYRCGD